MNVALKSFALLAAVGLVPALSIACSDATPDCSGNDGTCPGSSQADGGVQAAQSAECPEWLCPRTVCQKAEEIVVACYKSRSSGSSPVTCEGTNRSASECIVDHPVAACGEGSYEQNSAYADCLMVLLASDGGE